MNPPAQINGFPVIASRRVRARDGELPEQFYVICRDNRRDTPAFIVWTVAYDPNYQGGQWVASNGRYDMTLAKADIVMDERARARN